MDTEKMMRTVSSYSNVSLASRRLAPGFSEGSLAKRRRVRFSGFGRCKIRHFRMLLQFACLFLAEVVHGQAPTATPSVLNVTANPTLTPTFGPAMIPSGNDTLLPVNTAAPSTTQPTNLPTAAPSLGPTSRPTLTYTPTSSPTLAPTFRPTVSAAPSPLPSSIPSNPPSFSQAPTDTPTISAAPTTTIRPSSTPTMPTMPTGQPSLAPTMIPSTDIPTTFMPTHNPTSSSNEVFQRVFFAFGGVSQDLSNDGNKTELTEQWENMTSQFIFDFWENFYLSPFIVDQTATIFLSETRQGIPPGVVIPPPEIRFLQMDGALDNTTTDNDDGVIVTQPPTTEEDRIRTLYVDCRIRIFFKLVNEDDAKALFGEDYLRDLFLLPFEQPISYTNDIGWLTQSTAIPLIQAVGFISFPGPSAVPTFVPSGSPTHAPSLLPTPPPTFAPTGDEESDGSSDRLVVYVVVVVVVSVCLAAGYLYYLVRKEDQHPIVGGLPDDLEGRDYYVETTQSPPATRVHSRHVSDEADARPEENVPLNPSLMVPEEIRGVSGGTITTLATSASTTSNTNNPPPMAVLDDVPSDNLLSGGLGGSDEDDDDLGGINGIDGLTGSPSFDSHEGTSPTPPFDMTGFQMDVQNLDDV